MNQVNHSTRELYVATDGSDANIGTETAPFATLDRAKEEVRKIKTEFKGSITVLVRGGTYYLQQPLSFSSEDSGCAEGLITYMAYPGEIPVISGGKNITSEWRHYQNGIYMCELNSGEEDKINFSQLFINGKRQVRARFPNYDNSDPGKSGMINPALTKLEWPHKQFQFDSNRFTSKRWAKSHEGVVHMFGKNYWGNLQWQVEAVDWDTNTIHLGKGGFQINDIMQGEEATGIDQYSRYFIENIFEELDAPNEWYLDCDNGRLYWMPEDDSAVQKALVEVPLLKEVVEFRGTQDQPVQHIVLSGFRIAHTASTFLDVYEAPSLGDWSIHRGGAVYMEGTEHCTVTHCFFDAVGGNAVFLNNYNRYNRIYGNRISEAGDSGVCLVGSKHLSMGSNHAYPSHNDISNNLIYEIGVFGKQTAAVFISVSSNNTISHNHMYNLPRAAICINDGTWGGHVIEFNDIHDTVRETGDHGPFNSWGRDRFWCLNQSHGPDSHGAGDVKLDAKETVLIRQNRFVDNKGWGIDLDDGSSNYHIYNNLCIGISIKLREGDYRTVENNIFVNPANPPGIHIGYEGNHDRFVRNIIVTNSHSSNPEVDIDFQKRDSNGAIYEFIGPPMKGNWMKELDYNLFFNDIGNFTAIVYFRPLGSKTTHYSLQEWRKLGFDKNSIYANPLFKDPDAGDYSLRSDSPALQLGFENFDMNDVGLLPDFPKHWLIY